jgi:hypothetical protein
LAWLLLWLLQGPGRLQGKCLVGRCRRKLLGLPLAPWATTPLAKTMDMQAKTMDMQASNCLPAPPLPLAGAPRGVGGAPSARWVCVTV